MPHSETSFYRATTKPSSHGPLKACSGSTAHHKKQLRDNEAHATNEEGTKPTCDEDPRRLCFGERGGVETVICWDSTRGAA